VVGVVLLALAVALGWLGGRSEARLWIGLLAVQVVVLLLSPSFFYYYPAFAAPGLALVVGGATEVLLARSWVRESRAAVAVLLLLATLVAVGSTRTAGRHFPTRALQTLVTGTRCVTADSPDVLVLTNVLGRDLRRHCPVMVDVTGLTYDRDVRYRHGHPVARRHDHAWQRDLRTYLTSGGVAFIVRAQQDGLSGRSRRVLGRLPSLHAARDYVLQRVGPWGTRAGPGHATDGRTSFRAMSIRQFRRSTLTGP
jgi:hypothetical protein